MFKIPQIFILTGLLLVTSALQCYAADGYKQGAVEVEAGASIGSKVVGTSDKILTKKVQADGDKGYKYGISYGINDKFILQYKGGTFITERAQVPQKAGANTFILSGVARAEADEFNLLYKVKENCKKIKNVGIWFLAVINRNSEFSRQEFRKVNFKSINYYALKWKWEKKSEN